MTLCSFPINAYGECSRKKPHKDERPEDDSKFYQDVEQNIYDDAAKFKVTQEYSKKCSVKRENEGKMNVYSIYCSTILFCI